MRRHDQVHFVYGSYGLPAPNTLVQPLEQGGRGSSKAQCRESQSEDITRFTLCMGAMACQPPTPLFSLRRGSGDGISKEEGKGSVGEQGHGQVGRNYGVYGLPAPTPLFSLGREGAAGSSAQGAENKGMARLTIQWCDLPSPAHVAAF